jgi:D-alanyl-lipoteichoic acid acyltransferase DltB (MBOAT superfamily)
MLFNTLTFALFFILVFAIYWFFLQKSVKLQNLFLLIASYLFYGWWDWRFLSLIFISSLSDYLIGIKLDETKNQKTSKFWITLSIIINLSILGFFKYYNFFVDSFVDLFSLFGYQINSRTLNIVLPVGISFYTFQTMSYTLDVYRKQLKATHDFISFFAFVSFFPQLVAGPIERASNLLGQFYAKRSFDYYQSTIALRQILWGLFQKVVIADNAGIVVNQIFDNYIEQSGFSLILGAVFFAFQIYGDFAGYSNIAIGVARLLGFQLMQNFQAPYFSQNITEIWRRWHISLSTWLRDYLYTPLALKTRNWGNWGIAFSTMLTFILCGLWHGAAWKFVVFGTFHGIALTYDIFTKKVRKKWRKKISASLYETSSILLTFIYWTFTLIIFRANNIYSAFAYMKSIFSESFINYSDTTHIRLKITVAGLILLFIVFDFIGRNKAFAIETIGKTWPRAWRFTFYSFWIFLILMFFQTNNDPFIYFQF